MALSSTDLGANLAKIPTAAGVKVEKEARKRLGITGWFAVSWLSVISLAALLAPWLPIAAPKADFLDLVEPNGNPPFHMAAHILGLDGNGHDMLAQTIHGARVSLQIALGAVLMGMVIGGTLGLMAGYFKGKIDRVISTVFDIFLAVPALILAMSLVAFLAGDPAKPPTGIFNIERIMTLALGIVATPPLGRIARASTLTWSEREFVMAARAQGAKNFKIMFVEILPNVLPAMLSIALLSVGVVVIAEGGLSLLGVGVNFTDKPSWGNMIAQYAQTDLNDHPWLVFTPIIAVFLTVLSLNMLGDVIRARFDARETTL